MVERTTDSDFKIESTGDVVRAMREKAGLSLQQLADRIGADKSSLSKYENNQLAMSLRTIERIAEGLELAPLVVLFECLRHRYPMLRSSKSKVGGLVQDLVAELCLPGSKSQRN